MLIGIDTSDEATYEFVRGSESLAIYGSLSNLFLKT